MNIQTISKLVILHALHSLRHVKMTFLDMGAASGSLGGKVFSHNRYGNYMRTRAIPTNPNTSRQQAAKSRFQSMASRWASALSPANRTAWNLYGDSVDMLDALGQTINITGFNHYIRSNSVILQSVLPVVDAGPTNFSLPITDATIAPTISEALQQISVVFDDTMDWGGEDNSFMTVHMTSPQNASRGYLDIKPRYADVLLGNTAVPLVSPLPVAVPYAVVDGQKVIVKFRIGRADGRLSGFFQQTVTVAA